MSKGFLHVRQTFQIKSEILKYRRSVAEHIVAREDSPGVVSYNLHVAIGVLEQECNVVIRVARAVYRSQFGAFCGKALAVRYLVDPVGAVDFDVVAVVARGHLDH